MILVNKNLFIQLTALPIILFFLFVAASNTSGPDYINYIWMIDAIQNEGATFLEKIFIAKDVLFGFLVWLINPLYRDDYQIVIFYVLLIRSVHRLYLISKLGFGFYLYALIYFIFLAPGLDFAAIRALMGLSFVTIYLCISRFKILLLLLALLSHASMLIPIFFISRFVETLRVRFGMIPLAIVVILTSMVGVGSLHLLPQTQSYIDNSGSWLLLFRIVFLIVPLLLLYSDINKNQNISEFSLRTLTLSILLISTALGAIEVSVAASRIMELGVFFSLISLFSMRYSSFISIWTKRTYVAYLIILIISFSYRNILSGLWMNMFDLNIGNVFELLRILNF